MRFQIKNMTGDLTSPDSELWPAVKMYATSGQYQNLLPIDAQETVFVSERAKVELLSQFPAKFISVLDADGSEDASVSYRKGPITLSATWQAIDLGRFSGKISITNTHTSNTIKFSLSGGTGLIGAGGTPLAATISDILKSETITIDTVMKPVRYVYLLGSGTAEVAYILVN